MIMKIYHKYDLNVNHNFKNKIERIQYSAVLAASTGPWKDRTSEKLYTELGLESLYDRRWAGRLYHSFKLRMLL